MDQVLVRDAAKTSPFRRAMVDNQIRTFDVTDQRLLEQFYKVPRELFLPASLAGLAYSDALLTVPSTAGGRRAMLVPMVLARLLQGASLQPADRVLVVGDARGYTAAVLSGLVANVVMIETDAGLVAEATEAFATLGLSNVEARHVAALPQGDPTGAPFDVIVVAGAIEANHDVLLGQLGSRGRLVAIEKTLFDGVRRAGKAVLFARFGDDISARALFEGTAPVLDGFQQMPRFTF